MEILGFFLAALVGISLGIIGGGGSILTVPILVYVLGVNPLLATSYSLFIVGSTSMVGAANSYRKGLVNIKTALLFGISSIVTVYFTRKIIMPKIPSVIFSNEHILITQSMAIMLLFAVLMLLASVAMIKKSKMNLVTGTAVTGNDHHTTKLLFYGVMIGLVTGLLGAGGGFLIIPVLVILLKMPMKQAIGTSLLIIALNSMIGFAGDAGHFIIDWKLLLAITSMAVVGIFIGGYLGRKIDGNKLKKTFGWFVLLMGVYIIIKETILK
ncbi:sulfite exporter TauE/SafE family protein [Ferruginibacter lapsinanis]|uniref:sulfite exporter TauE/SafE family protein n=1 Tax=Ferruginibacter lapsinanis TaxID=563172 RepID=UPI001E329D55|nr:sulfite exporter TauE/SafE family protein [Ferruginibacter lapsinanis]UEG50130.1 sulfite exporter TauE/SafE family protein [Ferruginibacter lapsinanis]